MTTTLLSPPAVVSTETRAAPTPLYDDRWMARLIGSITGEGEVTVLNRLRDEYWWPGTSVSRDFAKRGLRRHEWSDGLIQFYGETDSFLYELAVWNRNWFKGVMRNSVSRYLAGEAMRHGRPLRVLSVGDGLGFDSLELARAGHDVTYYELPGRSEAFARRLFAETATPVRVITDLAPVTAQSFDVVVCLDVLEHVPDPSAIVVQLVGLVRPGGLTLFSAPFFLILPWYPTHLRANRWHSGSLALYEQHGVRLVTGSLTWAPLVFRKLDGSAPLGRNWLKIPWIVLVGKFLGVGRLFALPFVGCHVLRWMANRWFAPPVARFTRPG
jgi:SAM-dependent methyltransferase